MLTDTVLPLSFYAFRIVVVASIVSIHVLRFTRTNGYNSHSHAELAYIKFIGVWMAQQARPLLCRMLDCSAFSGKYFYQVVDLILVSF